MFSPKHNLKSDLEGQWSQSDRIFFGFGACHILVGVFLEETTLKGFYGEWITPTEGHRGTHMYVTNGIIAFDFHGYSFREKLLAKYWRGHQHRDSNWNATIDKIEFSLLDTHELNKRHHRGPNQYFADPIPRARKFINSVRIPAQII